MNKYIHSHDYNSLHALHPVSLPAYLPSVKMWKTCGGSIRAKWDCWAALRWASVCDESRSSTAASLSCLPDHWTCSGGQTYTLNVKSRRTSNHTAQFTKQRYGKETCTHYHKVILWLWTNSLNGICFQKKLTTNFITCSAWQDIKSLLWYLSSAVSSKESTPLNPSSYTQRLGYVWYLQPKQQSSPAYLRRVDLCESKETLEKSWVQIRENIFLPLPLMLPISVSHAYLSLECLYLTYNSNNKSKYIQFTILFSELQNENL